MSIPAAFDYHPAQTVDEALSLLQQYGDDAKILAGGHSLIPAMKLRLAQPEHLVDIGRIQGLSYIKEEQDTIAIGALTTYTQIERSDLLQQYFPLMVECASIIADQQVRNRGTIGGSIAHADPAGDMPGVILALKGEIVVQGPGGKRTIAADDFILGAFETALEPDEIVIELRFARPPAHTGSAYQKLANQASHYAIVGSAVVLTLDANKTCTAASVVITGASMKTERSRAVEQALIGKQLDTATITDAASHAADELELVSDIHGSEEYRKQMASVIVRRTINSALERIS
ncbi:carbon-monoxide dehydrogenase medium subunit [Thermosporothrix hazakensis]|jgi:carbon-monoxide dehydrogenase medium subunit|uniref:Carbon-monoxide dehydrogenase medium subunit n=2 Tax=Thermosporothrix TaxID=768650 RepID=A0A326UDS2_THEHA|nr:xanthine dehydrogenase family protein subunit M [Thermosporothrix hazakensis]PZW35991.1 carbon-monoxide dehydrogenase medium subunit [Thermosporothrix hazakensis]BBH88459.1 carbon monoxide dehydrogenase [Thermosporothrix sp. COM3]GCE46645.1 carbon monoxide dehydrogenase [Thermosporothrix hazakensis]